MDVEVFIDTWLQDLVTNLRQLMNFNTPLSSNIADILMFVVNRYLTQMTVTTGFVMIAVHFQLQNQEILSAQFSLCGVYLLSSTDLVDCSDIYLVSALHGHSTIVTLLLKCNNSVVSACDWCGVTPLIDSCRGNHDSVTVLLLKCGAQVTESDNMGLTCLHVAAQAGSCKVIRMLIEDLNIDVNLAAAKSKFTPLHCAANAGQVEAVRLLLLQGADRTLEDAHGRRGKCDTLRIWTDAFDLYMTLRFKPSFLMVYEKCGNCIRIDFVIIIIEKQFCLLALLLTQIKKELQTCRTMKTRWKEEFFGRQNRPASLLLLEEEE